MYLYSKEFNFIQNCLLTNSTHLSIVSNKMSAEDWNSNDQQEEEPNANFAGYKKNNVLPLWGNERTMNMNPLILTNIQSSHYFKNNLYGLKTYHEVIDEIYTKVQHLEPWEKGSRKTSGQTGMVSISKPSQFIIFVTYY